MTTVNRAIVVHGCGDDYRWTIEESPIPNAVEGSVVIQMVHAAMVQYSKTQFSGHGYPVPIPLTPGANGVGRVYAVGADATTLKIGDLVLVNSVLTPRDSTDDRVLLAFMTDGSAAAKTLMEGSWRNGTYQQFLRIPLENAFRLDEQRFCGELGLQIGDLSLIQTCAIAYAGLAEADVKAGDTVIVAPATGRFSGATVLTALALGANVVAAGRRQEPLTKLATRLGSLGSLETVMLSGEVTTDTERFKQAVGPSGAEVYMDWSPPSVSGSTPTYFSSALGAMRHKGTVMLMGGVQASISIPYWQIMMKGLRIQGRFMYEPHHLKRCIRLAESGRLGLGPKCGSKVVASFGLDQFDEALDKALELPGWGSVVDIDPSK